VDAAASGVQVFAGRALPVSEKNGVQTNDAEADGKTVWS
jgi:hypothetical protein